MARLFFLFLLVAAVVGGSLLPPSPLLVRGEHQPFYLQFLSEESDSDTECHCPTHEEMKKAFMDQARRDNGKIYYMMGCYGDFSQQAATIFKDIAPMGMFSSCRVLLALSESLIPSDFLCHHLSLSPPDRPPKLS